MKQRLFVLLFAAVLFAPLALSSGQDKAKPATSADAKTTEQIIKEQLPSYPAGNCLVSDEEIMAEDVVNLVHEGRLVQLCCNMCKKMFAKNPAEYLAELDKRIVAEQLPTYPLETCAMTGEKLGSMGDPIDYVAGTRLVRFCCKGCIRGFQKNPAKAMATVNEALIAAQLKTYPLETCVISGEKLGGMGEPINYLYGTKLVRFCCKSCVRGFEKDPAKGLAALAAK
jgi:hypothetical protein